MKHNNTEMLSPNDIPFVRSDSLAENIKAIQSFSLLVEDEDLMPVEQREIDRAVSVLEAIYAKTKALPFFIVPTSSGGIGIDYKIKDVRAYYRFDPHGLIYFFVKRDGTILKRSSFSNPTEAPGLLELI
jgi:hypothetical protein